MQLPTEAELAAAPIIDNWILCFTGQCFVLIGDVVGHPILKSDAPKMTSALLEMSVDGGWALTVNRYYRLGNRFFPKKPTAH
jgi:uncharacterized metal-binding protein